MEVRCLCIKTKARAACSFGNEVWLALQNGGLGVYDAETCKQLKYIPITLDGCKNSQIRRVSAVLNEVWAVTSVGDIFSVDGRSYKVKGNLKVPGSDKKAELIDVSFNGCLVVLASEAGSVLALHPITKKMLFSIPTSASCTAVVQFSSMIAAGDRMGALYLCDTLTQKCLFIHTEGKSDVLKLLYEPTHNRLWVARRNANIDLYDFEPSDSRFLFYKKLPSIGVVTGMVAVGGRVVVSTFEKQLALVDAANARILHMRADIHKMFIHDIVKVRHTESAEVWSLGNDGTVCACVVNGCAEPIYVPSLIDNQPPLNASPRSGINVTEAEDKPLTTMPTVYEQSKLFDALDNLRRAREEAQEMRLRSTRLEELLKVKNDELATKSKELKDLADRVSALTKNITDITIEKQCIERERAAIQSEHNLAKSEASRVSAEATNEMTLRIRAEEEVSQKKSHIIQMEQRLCDAESRLASMQAENAQLRESVGNSGVSKSAGGGAELPMCGAPAPALLELEKALTLNYSFSSALNSMEYTLRRKEEEEKDLNMLLNAYRLKAADHVKDSCLSALLIATITRCPERFELHCPDRMLSEFHAYTNPFINFLDSLRNGDPEKYQGLIHHLHQDAIGSSMSLETQERLDQLLVLAFKKGDLVGADALAAFRRGISSRTASNRIGGPVLSPLSVSTKQKPPPNGTGGVSRSFSPTDFLGAETVSNSAVPIIASVGENTTSVSPHPVQTLTSKTDIKEYREVFEFILYTRHPLVEHLVHLHQWTVNLKHKVEALSLEASSTSTFLIQSSTSTSDSSKVDLKKSLQDIRPMITEIDELVSFVVSNYLTAVEKQRLSVG